MNNHNEYDNAQLPEYARDPDYIADCRDPLRCAKGIALGIVLCAAFWGSLVALVWLANTYLGGG